MFTECLGWKAQLKALPPLEVIKEKWELTLHGGHVLHPHRPYYKVLGEGLQGAVHGAPHRRLRMGVLDTGVQSSRF